MNLSVSNFRGISQVDITLAPITLLAGKNGQGKTSLLQAIAAASAGVTIPIDKLLKRDVSQIIHDGARAASITLGGPDDIGIATVNYPGGERVTEGKPCEISKIAAGVESFIDDASGSTLKPSDRVRLINLLPGLDSQPRIDDLTAALAGLHLTDANIERLWQTISSQGWDAALDGAKRKGAELKGGWKEITGSTGSYGSQLAESWLPEAWTEDLRTETDANLTAAVADARKWLESAIGHQSVNASETERLRAAVRLSPGLQKMKIDAETQLSGLRETEKRGQAALEKIVIKASEALTKCPHCGGDVVIRGISVVKPQQVDAEQLSKDKKKREDITRALAGVRAQINEATAAVSRHAAAIADSDRAVKQLAEIEAAPVVDTPADTEGVRATLSAAEARLAAFTAYTAARAKHAAIQANQKIIDILAPDGLRISRLTDVLAELNNRLRDIAAVAHWPEVSILSDMSIAYGGRAYLHVSKAQKHRCRIVLQILWAQAEGAPMILIDDAEIQTDAIGRNGLFHLARKQAATRTVVIGMAFIKREVMPDMAAIGGIGYWIDSGRVA